MIAPVLSERGFEVSQPPTRASYNLLAIGVALCSIGATFSFSSFMVERETAQLHVRTEAEARHVASQIQAGLLKQFDSLHRLAEWWLSQGPPIAIEDWKTDAQLFLSPTTGLKQALWIDARGRQRWSVRPGEPPEVGGLQIVPPELAAIVAKARPLGSIVVSGLFAYTPAAISLYACVPVSKRGRHAGYIVGLYNVSELLDFILDGQLPGDYSVSLTADRREIHPSKPIPQPQWLEGARTAAIVLPNKVWSVRIVPSAEDLAGLRRLILSFGFLVTALLYLCTAVAAALRRRATALERMNDSLESESRERERSEQRVAELNRDLQRRLADFQTLIDVIPIGIAVSDDPECSNIWINPALANMMGIPQGLNISKTGPERDKLRYKLCRGGKEIPSADLPMQVAARTGASVIAEELEIVREDGKIVNSLSFSAPLFDENGRVRGVLNACVDITERTQTEQALRDSEQRYRLLSEALPQLVWTCRPDGDCDYLSNQWIEYTGIRELDQLGKGWAEALHPDDRERALTAWEAAVQDGAAYDLEYRIRGADGRYRWFKTRGVPLRDGNGAILKWFGTCTDIEDQRRTADRVRTLFVLAERRAAELAAVIESIPDALYIGNADGLSRCNSVALKLLGACTFDQLQKNFSAFGEIYNVRSINGERLQTEELPFTRALDNKTVVEEVIATHLETGADVFLRATAAPVRQDGRVVGAVLMNADVTNHKHLEQKLFERQRLESIGLLAGGVAHDFNNLLCAITGNASLLQSRLGQSDTNYPELQSVVDAAHRAADLTRQLLAYAGKGKFIVQPVDLSAMARDLAKLLRTSISRLINLEMDLEEGLPCIETDPGQIQQVLMNLIINAGEAIGQHEVGTIRVTTRSEDLSEQQMINVPQGIAPGSYVLLKISDTGCGIDDRTQLKMFDPFFTTKSLGRGLGLSAVAGIVRSHKGILSVNSSPGKGTTFSIWLPATQHSNVAAFVVEPQRSSLGDGTILVIDDEEIIRKVTKAMLEQVGYTVLLAEDGKAAINTFARQPDQISLVLLDLTMPVISGQETLKGLKAIDSRVPVIVSSGYSSDDVADELKVQGAAAFIKKPYTAAQLTGLISATLRIPVSQSAATNGGINNAAN